MYAHRPGGQDQSNPAYYPQPPLPHSTQAQVPGQANGTAYPPGSGPPPQQPTTLPSISEYSRPDMAVHHAPPPTAGPYPPQGYPVPPNHYPPYRPTHDPYRPPPAGYQPYPPPHQPAPRQRTAIACRYCRRRKIRCSGFDQSEDGRCANCQRFSQECVFTPVSAQTQAFVPAHAVYGRGGPPPSQQLFGAYGQPLPPPQPGQHDPYAASRPPNYTLPSPTGQYPVPQMQYAQPPPGAVPYAQYAPPHDGGNGSRKRPSGEPHTPTLPPPGPAEFRYPDPNAAVGAPVSPSSSTSHHSGGAHPYFPGQAPQQPRRTPPQHASPYTQDGRSSASPNTQNQPAYPPYPSDGNLRPLSTKSDGRTPPPPTSTPSQAGQNATAGASGTRPGLSISSIVSGDGVGRRQEDREMLKRLG